MPVYRYQLTGVNIEDLKEQVPPADASSISVGSIAGVVVWDVTALVTSKSDLDEYFISRGWTFISTDPVTTPVQDATAALDFATTVVDVTKAAASAGVSNTVSRGDHKHDISTASPSAVIDIGDAAAEGTATSLSRSDHQHAFTAPAGAPPVVASASAVGAATTPARSDHTHGGITDIGGNTGSIGYGVVGDITQIDVGDAASAGVSAAISRADHQHALPVPAAPVDVTKAAASAGASTTVARADHKHDVTTAAPISVGTANAEGTATSLARSDHVHDHGAQPLGDGTDHALVTTLVAGFMSPADKALSTTLQICNRFFPPTSNAITDVGNYATVTIGANATLNISFEFPDDFSSLVELVIVGIPVATFTAQDIDLFSNYSALGEVFSANAQSNTTSTYSGTINTLIEYSISSLYTSAAAGDYAGIRIDHNAIGTSIGYLGIRMRYTRV